MNTDKANNFAEFPDFLQLHLATADQSTKAVNLDQRMPWEQGCFPGNWATFLAQLRAFCAAGGWEVVREGSVTDHLCVIVAHREKVDEAEFAQQDFTDDDLPF